jgi:hypothetical protein
MPQPIDCLVHIGITKTGSTSVQNALSRHRTRLAQHGVYYPRSPGNGNHVLLPLAVSPPKLRTAGVHPGIWGGIPPEIVMARFHEEFPQEMTSLPEGTRLVVFSSEQCTNMLADVAAVERLCKLLRPYFRTIRMVAYLRRQDEHVASAYTQLLRDGVLAPPAAPRGGPQQLRHYDYAGILDRWAQVIGADAVVPRLFERSELVNGDVIDDFLALCGAPGAVPDDEPERAANPSVDAVGQALMLAVGLALPSVLPQRGARVADPMWRHFTAAVTELLPGRGWRMGRGEAQDFLARFAEGNETVRRRWFPERRSLFHENFEQLPESSALPAGDTLAAGAMAFVARLAEANLAAKVSHLTENALLREKLGRRELAMRQLNQAIRLDDAAPAPRLALAERLVAAGNTAMAQQHLAVARRVLPPGDAELERVSDLLAAAMPAT